MLKRKLTIDISILKEEEIYEKKSKIYNEIPLIDYDEIVLQNIINYGGCGIIYNALYNNNKVIVKKLKYKLGKHHQYSLKKIYNSNYTNILKPIAISKCTKIIVFPFINGISLNKKVFKKELIKGMLECVENLHNLEIIHSDIKHDNFMLDCNNKVILVDIDNSIPIIENKVITHCLYPQYGTIGFRRPLKEDGINYGDDKWSLGACIYYLYNGKIPYEEYIEDYDNKKDYEKIDNLNYCYNNNNINYDKIEDNNRIINGII
jgi:serine/threonine protein kinase